MSIVAKHSPYIVGIDLGTCNSTAAIFRRGNAEVIPVDGKPLLPSVVSVRESGEIVVGYPAKSLMLVDPENTVASVKREMGNSKFAKEFKGQPGKQYSATDISAEILAKIRSGVEASGAIDLRGSLRYAVICIPANFDDAKKQATLEAGKLAGLEVLWLLEEPVAAAVAYALQAKRDQKILVYDLGGGTFDVSILSVDSTGEGRSEFKVLAKEGIPILGGDDFDRRLMEIAAAPLKDKGGPDLFDEKKDQGVSRKALRQALQKLKEAAEKAKVELSDADSAEIMVPNLIKDESGVVHNIEVEVTRPQFEAAIKDLVLQTREAVERALSSAKLSMDEISRIILVGGSTRVPLVRQALVEMFGKEPYSDLDPATAVARGAAIYGATLGVPTDKAAETAEPRLEDAPTVSVSVSNIVTHYLGIELSDGRFSSLIEKGQEIPTEGNLTSEKEYTNPRDNMMEIKIAVYQASQPVKLVGDEGSVCIGEFFVTGLPPKPRGQLQVVVRFEINQQNVLRIAAHLKGDEGAGKSIEINRSQG